MGTNDKYFTPLTTIFISFLLATLLNLTSAQTCFYTCSNCTTPDYYECTVCQPNRGINGVPVSGMCYCSNDWDEDNFGNCSQTSSYNTNNKALIATLLALSLFVGLIMMLIRGMRYFLLKTIQDVQQLSLMIFINEYFPQQLDYFLAQLYRFNVSSYMFQSITSGTLFNFDKYGAVNSTDGQNIYGKYKLLYKTANFFSNSFTWILLGIIVGVIVFSIFIAKKCLKPTASQIKSNSQIKSQIKQEGHGSQWIPQALKDEEIVYKKRRLNSSSEPLSYKVVKRLNNIFWITIPIQLFYFSLIQLNINIFTQINNLTFSSSFAAVGTFFSASYLGIQIIIIFYLALKTRQQAIKPQWMRDYTYSPCFYLIRVNYKTLTKYFFFFSCIKKILIAIILTSLYGTPTNAVLSISAIQLIYLIFCIYLQPLQRRHLRLHLYASQGLKLFIYVSLLNFTERYQSQIQLIDVTQIFYINFIVIFGFHLVWMVTTLIVERTVYWYYLRKKLGMKINENQNIVSLVSENNEDALNKQKDQDFNNAHCNMSKKQKMMKKIQMNLFQEEEQYDQNGEIIEKDPQKEYRKTGIIRSIPFQGLKIGYYSEGKIYFYQRQ